MSTLAAPIPPSQPRLGPQGESSAPVDVPAASPPRTVIEAIDLGKCYHVYEKPADRLKQALLRWRKRFYKDFWAVRDCSFSVPAGQTVGIIGRNGSGKSTILQMIAGVLSPTTGRISVDGRVNALLELGTGFNPEFTGRENVVLTATIQGFGADRVPALVEKIARFADIGEFFDQPMKTYSSGMFVRVAFAAAVLMRPDILIVDEALAVGDIFFQQKCLRHMRDELAGVTKVLVTHDMGSIASLCDRCLVMHRGVLVFDGLPVDAIEFYTKLVHTEEFRRQSGSAPSDLSATQVALNGTVSSSAEAQSPGRRLAAAVEPAAWIDVDESSRGGAGEVVIRRVAVTDHRGRRLITARPGDPYTAWLVVETDVPKANLIFGAALIDRTGTPICGDNSLSPPGHPVHFDRPGAYVIRLEYQWPRLQPGNYTVTFGCGEGEDALHHVIQCWAHNVVAVAGISPDHPVHGVFTNPLQKFDVAPLDVPTASPGAVLP